MVESKTWLQRAGKAPYFTLAMPYFTLAMPYFTLAMAAKSSTVEREVAAVSVAGRLDEIGARRAS